MAASSVRSKDVQYVMVTGTKNCEHPGGGPVLYVLGTQAMVTRTTIVCVPAAVPCVLGTQMEDMYVLGTYAMVASSVCSEDVHHAMVVPVTIA